MPTFADPFSLVTCRSGHHDVRSPARRRRCRSPASPADGGRPVCRHDQHELSVCRRRRLSRFRVVCPPSTVLRRTDWHCPGVRMMRVADLFYWPTWLTPSACRCPRSRRLWSPPRVATEAGGLANVIEKMQLVGAWQARLCRRDQGRAFLERQVAGGDSAADASAIVVIRAKLRFVVPRPVAPAHAFRAVRGAPYSLRRSARKPSRWLPIRRLGQAHQQ